MVDLNCREIEERLTCFVNGGLPVAERAEVEGHLAACARCREALAATREAAALYATHLPAEVIVDYALGLSVEGLDRALLESHFAHCADCREELRLVESGRDSSPPAPVVARAPVTASRRTSPRSRTFALAATLAALSALSVWFAMRDRAPLPQTRVAFVELLPESSHTRGADGDRTAIDRGRTTTLLLAVDRAETFDDVRVKIASPPGGALLWEESGLTPAAAGAFVLLLPAGALPAGEAEIALEGRLATEWSEIARYRITLQP